jgi:hypothetical protein
MKAMPISIASNLVDCSTLASAPPYGARNLFDILSKAGAVIFSRTSADWAVHAGPEQEINEYGDIFIRLDFAHPLLGCSTNPGSNAGSFGQVGDLNFFQDLRLLSFHQFQDPESSTHLDAIASGQLALLLHLYPLLRPKYAFVDESGFNMISRKSLQKNEIAHVFWANVYGPAYVDRYGKDLFLSAPGWKKQALEDGGVLYVTSESFGQWWRKKPKDVSRYFKARLPGLRLYTADTKGPGPH